MGGTTRSFPHSSTRYREAFDRDGLTLPAGICEECATEGYGGSRGEERERPEEDLRLDANRVESVTESRGEAGR